ncbi:TPA: Hok/Gef family protein [Salmonella enterica subsp. enterica serovar Hvittingfoss]|nr:Hok/Gef family protein [Salmonella enterica subsp. enterica serovar Hvittingfoss]
MTRNLLILAVIVVIAVTVLVFAHIERGSLCEMRLYVGKVEFAALLNYENRS